MQKIRLFALTLLFGHTVAIAETTVTIAFDSQCIPTMYLNSRGEVAGIYPAIVRRAFEKMAEPVVLVAVPFRRVMDGLYQNKMAAGSVVSTKERLAISDYSASYFLETVSIYYRKNSNLHYTGIDNLKGKSVGVILGWAYGEVFDNAASTDFFRSQAVTSDLSNFRKLEFGRIDYAVATTVAGQLLQTQSEFGEIEASQTFLTSIPIHLAFNKKANRVELLRKFNSAVNEMRASGELSRVAQLELEQANIEWRNRRSAIKE